jgi:hypothetical protein
MLVAAFPTRSILESHDEPAISGINFDLFVDVVVSAIEIFLSSQTRWLGS